MFKILIKNVKKNFSNSNQNKFEEAKKKAMEMYEKIQNQEKLTKNKKVEEEFLKSRNEDTENLNLDVSHYKKENVKNKIENFLENYQYISQRKKLSPNEEGINLNYYNKIHDDIVYFKLSKEYKNNIDKEKWVKIYEAKFDPNYEKFLNFLNKFLKIVLLYGTILFITGIYKKKFKVEKNQNLTNSLTKKEIFLWCFFYTIVTWIYIINRGFINRTIYKLLAKDDKIRIFLNNSNKKEQNKKFIETDICKLFSITSKSKNLHEIFYYGEKQKVLQMFANKNAFYDKNLLVNLCHPKVKSIKFTNLDTI